MGINLLRAVPYPVANQKILYLYDWNTAVGSPTSATVTIPNNTAYTIYDWMGNVVSSGTSTSGGFVSVSLNPEPIYLIYVGS